MLPLETGEQAARHVAMPWRGDSLRVSGLEARQALVCVGHVAEEIPDAVTQWMCLPDPGDGRPLHTGSVRSAASDTAAAVAGHMGAVTQRVSCGSLDVEILDWRNLDIHYTPSTPKKSHW